MAEPNLKFVDQTIARLGRDRQALIPILQAIQEHYHYLPAEALERLCRTTEITPAAVAGVSTFFMQFRHRPAGRHLIAICHGTACHVKGAGAIHEALERALKLSGDQDTDPQGLFTVQKVACLGCCTLAPVMQIDRVTYGHLAPDKVPAVLRDFLELQKRRAGGDGRARPVDSRLGEIRIGLGSCCQARGSGKVREALETVLRRNGLAVPVKKVGCVGMCHQTPLLEFVLPGQSPHLYARVAAGDVEAIVLRHLRPRGVARRLGSALSRNLERLLTDESSGPVERYALGVRDQPVDEFLSPQRHIATEHCGQIDPTDLDEYLAREGFAAWRRVTGEFSPQQVIDEIARSGLRGRGGAGYPTGRKWQAVGAAAGQVKYIVCNGDEGDPGAFMDRMILESYPYRVIEGMMIAAYAVGAGEGYFYVRAEYPLALERLAEALRQCRQRGILGDSAPGTGRGLQLHVAEGAGAFVCGEETALLASIEGRRGMPRLRPPYPAVSGLWGKPTLINNVETFALVPWIIRNGADAFSTLGTENSKGTKVFALAGKIARGGLVEVPMGATLGQIVNHIGGGIAGGKQFKAVQIGGPSGGCLPASLADTPVDYEALTSAGAIMGSGGLVVLDETDCMVEIARYFLEFTQDQSCGKCTFCRIGTRRMLDIMNRLCDGSGRGGDLEDLEQLALQVKRTSLCGLGRTAPNPILTTLRYFRSEYESHLQQRCPAKRCKALIRYSITDDCIGCTLCAQHCPVSAIAMRPYEKHEIDQQKCTRCDTCRTVCPSKAVVVE